MGPGGHMHIWSKRVFPVFGLAMATSLLACSTHPLPDDISRETSVSIIRNIRCEARDEFIRQVARLLARSQSPIVRAAKPESVIEKPESISAHDREIAGTITKFTAIAIAYQFKFHITEENRKSASASFLLPFIASKPPADRGNFGLGLGGGVHLKRDATREISMVESFLELFRLDCSKASERQANLLYPITGTIGMGEIVSTFLKLGASGAGPSKPKQAALRIGSPAKFVDKLTFTTFLQGEVNPKIVLFPVGDAFQLAQASASLAAERTDVHEMIVTLEFPEMQVAGGVFFGRAVLERENIFEATKKRAAEELCIQRALALEEEGIVRAQAPENYCRSDFSRFAR